MPSGRRLAALMLTDMVGYSSTAQRSESDALRLLEEHRVIVRGALHQYHGREVKTLGDGFLVEFSSAMDAIECARDIQREFYERNLAPGIERIDLRIALHVGDVVVEGTDLLGDAVNIVARLEPLSQPGGILVSGPFLDQVRGKIDFPFESIPTPPLKHILRPVAIFRAELPWLVPPIPRVTPWTDRVAELERLLALLEVARGGEGRIVVVRGEAGVGKTRLVEEMLGLAATRGFRILRARVHRGEREVPYAPWAEAVRAYAREVSNEALTSAAGEQPGEIVRLVPELVDRLGVESPGAADSPVDARNRLCDAIIQFFRNVAAEQPLVLSLDGVQWADPYSCHLLERAVGQLAGARWLILATHRDADPAETPEAGRLWTGLRDEAGFLSQSLGRLGTVEFDQLLDALLPKPKLPPSIRQLLRERSDGNPLFAEELVRQLIDAGRLVRAKSGWELKSREQLKVPESIRLLLQERLAHLDPATVQVLRVASVAGGRCSYSALQRMTDLSEDLLLLAVERAIHARVVEEQTTPIGEVEVYFRDPQTCQFLYEGLSLVRARSYHRKLAEAIEQLPTAGPTDTAAALADHFQRGGVPAKALEYSVAAGRRSAQLHAHEEAVRRFEVAAELEEQVGGGPSERAEILAALAEELKLLGRSSEAVRRGEDVARLYESAGEVRKASSYHSWAADLLNDLAGEHSRVLTHSERAVALLESTGDSPELAQAYNSLAANTFRWGNDPVRARELFRTAVEIAARVGDLRTEVWGGYFLVISLPFSQKREAVEIAERIVAKLSAADHPTTPGIMYNVASNLYSSGLGNVGRARALLDRASDFCRRHGIRRYDTAISLALAELGRLSGDWEGAETRVREVREREPEENVLEHVEAWFLQIRLAIGRGRLEDARESLVHLEGSRYRDILATPEARLPLALLRTELRLEGDDFPGAEATLAPAFEASLPEGPPLANAVAWTQALYYDAALAVHRKDAAGARSALERLRGTAAVLDEPWARGWTGRAEGMIELAFGDPAKGSERLSASLAEWESLGWPFELGRGLYELARGRLASGDSASAEETLDRARSIFAKLGADRAVQRIQAALETPGSLDRP